MPRWRQVAFAQPLSGTISNYNSLDASARKGPQNKTHGHTDNQKKGLSYFGYMLERQCLLL